MKPLTAAQKLGIYLPATPEEFQHAALTRDEVEQLRDDPPPWLVELRRRGPFPRDVVARRASADTAVPPLASTGVAVRLSALISTKS